MKKITIIAILFFPFLSLLSNDVHLQISNRGQTKIRIAVLDIMPEDEVYGNDERRTKTTITEILSADLSFSPFFSVLDTLLFPARFVQEEKDIEFFKWSSAGAQFLVFGKFRVVKDELRLGLNVFSIIDGKKVFKRDYKGDPRQIRRMVHVASDDIIKALTGEEGICRTQIAFVSNKSGSKEVYVCDYDGYDTRQITNSGSITLTPRWSPGADMLTYTSYKNGNPDLYLYDVYKNTEKKISDYPGLNTQATWSPDGRKIALCLTKDGNSEIYLMDIRTFRIEQLTHSWAIETSPSFSPGGNEIAFISDRTGNPQIYIMDQTGSNVRRLTIEGKYNDTPAWSPRGDKIAFAMQVGGQFQIATIDVTGDNLTVLTDRGNNESPSWSPDGYHIVFFSDRFGAKQLFQVNWDGTGLRRITNTTTDNTTPVWSSRYNWKF